jgi:serine/threonine protein kinase
VKRSNDKEKMVKTNFQLERDLRHSKSNNNNKSKVVERTSKSKSKSKMLYSSLKLNEIKLNSYTNIHYITNGTFSKVYKAEDKDGNVVAIKKVHKRFSHTCEQESRILCRLNSPYIIKMNDIFDYNNYWFMIFPYYKTDLFTHLPNICFKPERLIELLLGISEGLLYLHNKGYMHGDIKPENIMIDNDGKPILIDLGLGKDVNLTGKAHINKISGTISYLAPEIFTHQLYTKKLDIWGLGVIMYIGMFNENPFDDFNIANPNSTNNKEIIHNIIYREVHYPKIWRDNNDKIIMGGNLYLEMIDLNDLMLFKNYKNRINIKTILNRLMKLKEMFNECSDLKNTTNNKIIKNLKRCKTV